MHNYVMNYYALVYHNYQQVVKQIQVAILDVLIMKILNKLNNSIYLMKEH